MSLNDPTAPISPARFAAALKDLPTSSVALKAAEIQNSIAHLEYSNAQLQPFAHPALGQGESDPDCVDAIKENEAVILRMQERIELLKAEVEQRGLNWEFAGPAESNTNDATVDGNGTAIGDDSVTEGQAAVMPVNGTTGPREERHSAWADGTFQVGRISGGQVMMNGAGNGVAASAHQGGRLGDDELRRRMEERMRASMEEDDDEGIHL